jgi:hypothetical protein
MLRIVTHIRRQYASFRASRADIVPIGSLIDGEIARIAGTVQAVDNTLTSSFTQRAAVLYVDELRVAEYEYHPSSGNDRRVWRSKAVVEDSVPFWVVDDAGKRALVDPDDAEVNLEVTNVGEHDCVNDDNPRLSDLLAKHGVPCVRYMGLLRGNEFTEVLLAPGDRVSIAGRCRMTSVRAGAGVVGYRDDHLIVPRFGDEGNDPVVIMTAAQ